MCMITPQRSMQRQSLRLIDARLARSKTPGDPGVGSGSGRGPIFTPKNFYDSTFPSHCGYARCKMTTQQPVAHGVVLFSRCGSF